MTADIAEQLVDGLNKTYGVHPGRRAAHAKGILCAATFTPTADAATLSRAPQFAVSTRAHVRFSNGSGNPDAPDNARDGRGMAVKFYLHEGTTDIVAMSLPAFFTRTPEELVVFNEARRPDPATGAPDPEKVGAFLADHPEAMTAVTAAVTHPIPASYTTLTYHALHSFGFVNHADETRYGRYHLRPTAGEQALTDEEAAAQPADYLQTELADRLKSGPARFTVEAQLADDGDPIDDPTAVWPDDRATTTLGTLDITALAHDRERGNDILVFDPTRVPDGIVLSEDAILHARAPRLLRLGRASHCATMTAPLGVGLIGAGMIGQGHAYALRLLTEDGDVRPVAVTDFNAEAVENARNICPFERIAPDAQAVIDDPDVEAVVIVTPTTTHRALVDAVLQANKPFLCEKPLATSFDIVQAMCAAVARSDVTAQVGFHSRFHPLINELVRITSSGELGAPMGYTFRDDQYWPTGDVVPGHSSWRSEHAHAGGGALLEHSIHSADILSWLFGPATNVYARTRNVFGYDVEDTTVCTIEHASGVVGTLISIFNGVRGREERRLEVFFERGAVEVTTDFLVGAREDGFLIQRPDHEPEIIDVEALRNAAFERDGITRRDFFVYLYPAARTFVQAVKAQRAAAPGFPDALAAHALVDAAYRSAASGNAETVARTDA